MESPVHPERKVTEDLWGSPALKETLGREVLEDQQVNQDKLELQEYPDKRGVKEWEVKPEQWAHPEPEDRLEFLEMSDLQANLDCKDHQALLENLEFLETEANQDHLVKSSLRWVRTLWPYLDLLGLLELQVRQEHLVCLVPSVLLVFLDNLVQRVNKEKRESRGRGERRESQEHSASTKKESDPKPSAQVTAVDSPCLDLLVHLDHQDHLEHLDLKAHVGQLNRVLKDLLDHQDLKDAEVLLESEVRVYRDPEERKENLAALFLPQGPSLLDHQDHLDHLDCRVYQVMRDPKDTQVNQDNQVFQVVQGNQVQVFLVCLDQWGLGVHRDQRGLQDQEEIEVSLVLQEVREYPQQPWAHTVQALQARRDHLELQGEMPLVLDLELMWASTLQSTCRVSVSDNT